MSVLNPRRNEVAHHSVDRYRVLFDLIPIRAQSARWNLVLVALTAYGQEEARRQRSVAAGFDHHLTKPAHFKQLKQILARVQA